MLVRYRGAAEGQMVHDGHIIHMELFFKMILEELDTPGNMTAKG